MFGSKKKAAPAPLKFEDVFTPTVPPAPPVVNIHMPAQSIMQEIEYRPVWVKGRKGLFHRWVNTAKPSAPRGAGADENTRYFQYRSTKALVEFENGAMETVWPQDFVFADGGRFKEFEWLTMEQQEAGHGDY